MSKNSPPESSDSTDGKPFRSVDDLRAAHSKLLKRLRATEGQPQFWDEVATFIRLGRAVGKVLDTDADRWDSQSSLDYWSTLMFRKGLKPPDATLADFDLLFDPTSFPELDESQRPYIGLQAFDEARQGLFFGRLKLIDEIIEGLKRNRWLSMTGPPGSGKSSLVLAGVIPALKDGKVPESEKWHYCPPISPGLNPLLSLASLIPQAAPDSAGWAQQQVSGFQKNKNHLLQLINNAGLGPTLIFCDRFEEIFMLTSDESVREAFIKNLLSVVEYPDVKHTVIIAMRDEFEAYIAKMPELQAYFSANTVRVRPMYAGELREAIEKPAALAGLKFEEGIVDELVNAVLGEPGGTTLLQFTLSRLWDLRRRNLVTWEALRKLGAGRDALKRSADAFYGELPEEDQSRVKRILLRLVRWGEGLKVLSDRIPRAELLRVSRTREQIERLLDKLIEAGLLKETKDTMSGDAQIEVSHESLMRDWGRLVEWLEDERITKRQRLQLADAAKRWDTLKRDQTLLLGGSLLDEALRLRNLPPLETEFVRKSKQKRQIRRGAVIFSIALAIAVLIVMLWVYRSQRNQARQAALEARSRVLAYQAFDHLKDQLDLSLLLSREAYNIEKTVEARGSLLAALTSSPQVVSFLHGHKGAVKSVAFSPTTGMFLASGGDDGNGLYLWRYDERSGQWKSVGDGPLPGASGVNVVAFSHDEKLLASGGDDGSIRLWDTSQPTSTPRTLREGGSNEDPDKTSVVSLAFSADDKTLISASIVRDKEEPVPSKDSVVMLWDIQTSNPRPFPKDAETASTFSVENIVVSDDGSLLAYLFGDGAISIWKVEQQSGPFVRMSAPPEKSEAGEPEVVERKVGEPSDLSTEKGPTSFYADKVNVMAFSPDGTMFALGGAPSTGGQSDNSLDKSDTSLLTIWTVAKTPGQVGNRVIVTSSVRKIIFQDKETIAAGDSDGIINRWMFDQNLLRPVESLSTGQVGVSSLTFKGDLLAAGSLGGAITLFNLKTPRGIKSVFAQEDDPVCALDFSPDGNILASRATSENRPSTTTRSNPIKLRQVNGDGKSTEIPIENDTILSLALSADNQTCAWGNDVGTITLCNVVKDAQCSQKKEMQMPGSGKTAAGRPRTVLVKGLAFSSDRKLLASFSNLSDMEGKPNPIILWDVSSCDEKTCKQVRQLNGHVGELKSIAFSPDGKFLSSAGAGNNTPYLWDTQTWEPVGGKPLQLPDTLSSVEGGASGVNAVAFSAVGKLLASGGEDGTIILWDLGAGQPVGQPIGRKLASINSLSFNKDGKLLASGGSDGAIILWDVPAKQQIRQLQAHTQSVRRVIFSGSSDKLASSGDDGAIILWDFDVQSWLATAAKIANRQLTGEEKTFYGIGERQF